MEFVELAEKYCSLIENIESLTIEKLFIECEHILPQIFSYGINLEYNADCIDEDETAMDVESPLAILSDFLGENNYYNCIFDPIKEEEVVVGSIADDLADIYLDLKRPLLQFRQNTEKAKSNALWQWQFNILHHSGDHILNVLKPIFWINHTHGIKEP